MEILIGFFLCLLLEFLAVATVVTWRKLTTPTAPPQPPKTAAQMANRAMYEAERAYHPQLVSMRFRRRTKRGRTLREVEEESEYFED